MADGPFRMIDKGQKGKLGKCSTESLPLFGKCTLQNLGENLLNFGLKSLCMLVCYKRIPNIAQS